MSEADRLKEIEKKLHRLSIDIATLNQSIVEFRKLDTRRLEDKLDMVILKLFEPEQLRLHLEEFAGTVESTAAPEDVENLLNDFLALRGR